MVELTDDTLFQGVPEGLALCDPTTTEVVEVNERFCTLIGREAASLEGTRLVEFEHETATETPLRDAIETASGAVFDWTIRDEQGNPVPLALSVGEVRADGAVYALVSARPATDGDSEAELAAYRRRLDGAMIAGGVAWWEMDVETGRVLFHENKTRLLGYSSERFQHYEDFVDIVHPEDRDEVMAAMRSHLDGDAERYDTEYRIETSSGDYEWFHDIGGVTERTADGAPAKVTGIVVDVSERKRLEERLQDQNDQLALLNRLIRHDIRNDMMVALGWLEAIKDGVPADVQTDIDRVVSACTHTVELTTLSRDLVDVIVENDEILDSEPVDLRDTVLAEVEKARQLFEQADIDVAGDVPAVTVEANAMLSSVLSNLINNTVQHNDKPTPEVRLSVETLDDIVQVRVADNGPGIPDADRSAVFGRDHKGLDSEGTGMGLYLVETLLDAYGGDVRIEANDPTGCVFVVDLNRL